MARVNDSRVSADRLRRTAEERLLAEPLDLPGILADESTLRLVHELQVHQIELEMQNEELRQTRDELDTALEKCTDLYEFAPVGYITLDRDGGIVAANLTAAGLFGVERSRLIGQCFNRFVSATERPLFDGFLDTVFTSRGRGTCEISLHNDGKLQCVLQVEAIVAVSAQKCRLALIDITGRRQAEDALRESEDRMYRLTEMAIDAIIILDANGMVTFCNTAAEKIFGYSAVEIMGREFQHLMIPERLQVCAKEFFDRIREQGTGSLAGNMTEVVAQRKDGTEFTLELSVSALNIKEKWHAIAIMRDVTERRRMETEVQTARKYAENIVNTVRRPLVVLNSAQEILSANQNFYSTFRVSPEETVGKLIYDIGNRQWDIPELRTLFEEILDHDSVFNRYEVGHDFPVIGHKNILLNARRIFKDSLGTHFILLAMEDITERRQTEERISEIMRQQQAILDNIPNITWLKDREGRYLAVNDSFCKEFDLLPGDVVGKTDHEIFPAELADEYEKNFREVIATGKRTYFEDSVSDAGGKVRHLEKIKTPVFNDAGAIIGIIGIAHDITNRKEVEAKLRHDSTHDMLTGLYNRAFFEEELERFAHGRKFPLSIVMADINGLKTVNDTSGHEAGDQLIRLAAKIILHAFRSEDIVARIGGDEFAVLLPETAEKVAEEAVMRIRRSPEICNSLVSIAFGIASAENRDQFAEALKLGDERMYQDKSAQNSCKMHNRDQNENR